MPPGRAGSRYAACAGLAMIAASSRDALKKGDGGGMQHRLVDGDGSARRRVDAKFRCDGADGPDRECDADADAEQCNDDHDTAQA
jgi:hypothetical protein